MKWIAPFILSMASVSMAPLNADSLFVAGPVTITRDTTFEFIRVAPSGMLTADGRISVTGDMIILSGGIVAHTTRIVTGLRLSVTGTLDVQSGGLIDLTGKGLRGGNNGSVFGINGEVYDQTGAIVGGGGASNQGAGASYGGQGASGSGPGSNGISNRPYSLLEDSLRLGSGGGGTSGAGTFLPGGNGGGLATILAGTCIMNGTLRANGGTGTSGGGVFSGGGSGGGILLDVGTLSGSGQIEAIGGNGGGAARGGSGGGGRVAVYYNTLTFMTTNISARGGSGGGNAGSEGTIYLKDKAQPNGDLIISNGNVPTTLSTPLRTGLATFRSLLLTDRGALNPVSADIAAFTIEQPTVLQNGSSLRLGTGVTMTVTNTVGFDLDVRLASTLTLDSAAVVNANAFRVSNAVLNANINMAFPVGADLELSSGGTINILSSASLSVGFFDTTNIKSGTLNLSSGTRLDVATSAAIIGPAVTIVKDGQFGTLDAMTSIMILSGGIVTHSTRSVAGLHLKVTGTLDIQSDGLIDLTGKGLRGGNNGSVFGINGEVYDQTGAIVGGGGASNQGAGASYGGQGASGSGPGSNGISNRPYSLLEDSLRLGSGGGGTSGASTFLPGGNGGGLATILAGTCIMNGTLRANGGTGTSGGGVFSGGGSGGGILLDVGTLSGSGQIEAIGGNGGGAARGGSGGGGRISIYCNASTFPTANMSARGGSSGNAASAGTIYLKEKGQPNGNLIIDNGNIATTLYTPLRTGLATFRSLLLTDRGALNPVGADIAAFAIEQPTVLQNGSSLSLGSGVTMTVTNAVGFDLDVLSGSTLTLGAGSELNLDALNVNNGTFNTSNNLSLPAGIGLVLSGAGSINLLDNASLTVGVFDTTNMKSGTVSVGINSQLAVQTLTIMVGPGITIVKDGLFGPNDQMGELSILSGGVVTNSARSLSGLKLNIIGTLLVSSGGSIDVSGKGLKGGNNGSLFGRDGEAMNDAHVIIGGAHGGPQLGAGASYGGLGGNSDESTSNPIYGSSTGPNDPGAGGGGSSLALGGNGGGIVFVESGNLIVNGSINADGTNGQALPGASFGGGGSGGSILLRALTISGTGQISARGGNGHFSINGTSGSGGGGRVAIYFGTNTFGTTNITVAAGPDGNPGSLGTVHFGALTGTEPVILSVTPNRGGNTGYVTITIIGANFVSGTKAKLARTGFVDIIADSSSVQFFDSGMMTTRFDLTSAPLGTWNVVVTNPNGAGVILTNGFTTELGNTYDYNNLTVDIVGRREVRVERMNTQWIEVTNTGNVDEYDVMLFIKLPIEYKCVVGFPAGTTVDSSTSTLPTGGAVGDQIVFPVWLYRIQANSIIRIPISVQPPPSAPSHSLFEIVAELYQPQPGAFDRTGRLDRVRNSSIYTIGWYAYSSLLSRNPTFSAISVLDFQESLAQWLQLPSKIDQTSSLSRLVVKAISDITGGGPVPDSVSQYLSNELANSIETYFLTETDEGDVDPSTPGGPDPFNPTCKGNGFFSDPCRDEPCVNECLTNLKFPFRNRVTCVLRNRRFCDASKRSKKVQGVEVTWYCHHQGVDFDVPPDAPPCSYLVYPPVDGTMTVQKPQPGGYGNWATIRDACGNIWTLAHLDRFFFEGTLTVFASVPIGCAGESGNAKESAGRNQLHVELRVACSQTSVPKYADPNKYFRVSDCAKRVENPERNVRRFKIVGERENVRSKDPNEKVGRSGIGSAHFLSARDALSYAIVFENVDTASAPAQVVVITDTLDKTRIDSRTFTISSITVGRQTVKPYPGSPNLSKDLDLRPGRNMIVRMNAGLDTISGVVTWRFESIDPATGKPPEFDGFLVPNMNPPDGEGSVSFTVLPLANLPTSEKLRNHASIIFDSNPAMQTGEWHNTIDKARPHSRVLSLPSVQDSTTFWIQWAGVDSGSGIIEYSIYAATDSGEYQPWLENSASTKGMFSGLPGRRYRFFSIARDSVGNVELPKDSAEARTIITSVAGSPERLPWAYELYQNYPNPFNPSATIRYALPQQSHVTLRIYNILGQEVKTLINESQQAGFWSAIWNATNSFGNPVASGVYLCRIEAIAVGSNSSSFLQVKKMLLLK